MPNSQHRLFFSEIMFLTDFKQKDSVRLCGDTKFKGKPDIYFDRHLGFDGYDMLKTRPALSPAKKRFVP